MRWRANCGMGGEHLVGSGMASKEGDISAGSPEEVGL